MHATCVITYVVTKYSGLFRYKDYKVQVKGKIKANELIWNLWIKKTDWKKHNSFLGILCKNKIYTSETVQILRENTYGTKIDCISYTEFIKTYSVLHWLKNSISTKPFLWIKTLASEKSRIGPASSPAKILYIK